MADAIDSNYPTFSTAGWPHWGYGADMIPTWCRMSPSAHETIGGCWGISSGQQATQGEEYCLRCECYQPTQ